MTTTTIKLELDAIKARKAAASKGPWRAVDLRHQRGGQIRIFSDEEYIVANVLAKGDRPDADAEFIEHAHDDIQALLDRVDELEAELAKTRQEVKV